MPAMTEQPAQPDDAELPGIWATTQPDPVTGEYGCVISYGPDLTRHVSPEEGLHYALAVAQAALNARNDGGLLTMFTQRWNADVHRAAASVAEIRQRRARIDHSRTAPLKLYPTCNSQGKPFLRVEIAGKPMGQWSVATAMDHAMTVLGFVAQANADQAFYEWLTETIETDAPRARAAVATLGHYYSPWPRYTDDDEPAGDPAAD